MATYKIDHENNKSTIENPKNVDKDHEDEKLNKKSDTKKNGGVTTEVDIGSSLEAEKDINTY